MVAYSIVGLAIAIPTAGALVAMRRIAIHTRSNSLDIAAVIGGLVFLASLVAAAMPPFVMILDVFKANLPSEAWQRAALTGALIGGVVYLLTRVLLVDVFASLLLWTTRRENDDRQPVPVVIKNHLIHVVVTSCLFAGFFVLVGVSIAWLPYLALALLIAAFPLYEGQIRPWIEYRKARRIENHEFPEIRSWLHQTCKDRQVPHFKIRVRETNLNNAMATAGMFGHLIVVGGGLLKNLEPHELKAVIAHEVAHVVNRDMTWLTLISIVNSACFMAWMAFVSVPLMNEGGARMAAGVALLFVGAAISMYPLTATFSPRLEFRADRVAATMLGDARPLAAALERMAELTEMPMDMRTWTHPSYKARIEALEKLQERLP